MYKVSNYLIKRLEGELSIGNEGGYVPNTEFPPGYNPNEEAKASLKGQETTERSEYEESLLTNFEHQLEIQYQELENQLQTLRLTVESHYDDPRYIRATNEQLQNMASMLKRYSDRLTPKPPQTENSP